MTTLSSQEQQTITNILAALSDLDPNFDRYGDNNEKIVKIDKLLNGEDTKNATGISDKKAALLVTIQSVVRTTLHEAIIYLKKQQPQTTRIKHKKKTNSLKTSTVS